MRKYLYYYFVVYTVITGFCYFFSYLQISGSQYVYPIDDAYIHLAIAKNFGEYGFWSINMDSFDSASSSILYTLILSFLIKFFGENIYYPAIVNCIAGYFTVYWVYRFFRDFYSEKELRLGLILLLPTTVLHCMVLIGMEQTLHMLLSVMAIYFIKKNLTSDFKTNDFVKLLVVLFFLAMIRFESMFFVSVLGLILLLAIKIKEALLVFVFGFLPILIFGMISVSKGGLFFPNSIIIKGNYPDENLMMSIFNIFKKGILLNVSFYKLFLFPLICIVLYGFKKYNKLDWKLIFKNEKILLLVAATIVLQSLFAVIKYRYENYLMIMLLLVLIPIAVQSNSLGFRTTNWNGRIKILFFISFMGFCMVGVYRFVGLYPFIKYSTKNIAEQQMQMGKFLNQFYKEQKVVANDIGAIAYFGNVKLLDIVGLGSTDVTKFYVKNKGLEEDVFNQKYHQFLSNYIQKNQYKVAIIYPSWFPNKVPNYWIPVASWKIHNKVGVAQDRVVWYAFDTNGANTLRKNLQKFDLNKNVEEWIYLYK